LATRRFGQLALSSRRACRREPSLTPAKAPIDVRRRSYVAGPVHVRWHRTPDPLQQALYRDVRVLERGRQARPHASRNPPISGLIGQPVRHSRRVPPSAGHRSQRRQDDQQRARLRKWAENLRDQPADGWEPTRISPNASSSRKSGTKWQHARSAVP
jgi:hypothetical protein